MFLLGMKRNLPSNMKEKSSQFAKELRNQVYDTLELNRFPLILGGDHSLAVGSIFGASRYCIEHDLSLGIIWLDAHADMNTPYSSETGNIHGMPLATVLGQGYDSLLELASGYAFVDSENVSLVGIRDVDLEEQIILDDSNISYYRMEEIRKTSAKSISQKIKKSLIDKVDHIHLSFDLDVMDPSLAPSVSTPVSGGMLWHEAQKFLQDIANSGKLLSMDIVEYNPVYEQEDRGIKTTQKVLETVFSCNVNL